MYRVPWTYGRVLCGTYYRARQVGGEIPRSGPLLVVTNHTNGLADAGLLFLATDRPLRIIAKSTILRLPVLGRLARWAGVVPVYRRQDQEDTTRNVDAFRAVHEALAAGQAISIFPEGTSTDPRPSLRRFKSGAARMALGPEGDPAPPPVRVLPVGILYEARDRFRSRVHLWVGEPRGVEHLRETFAADPLAAVERLTAELGDALREVTLELERFEDRALLGRAEALWPRDARGEERRLQDLAAGLRWLRHRRPDEAGRLLGDLAALDPPPRAGDGAGVGPLRRMIGAATAGVWALALAFCALPWAPVLLLAHGIGLRARPSPDKFVTTLLVACSLLVPLWALVATLLAGAAAGTAAALATAALLAATLLAGPRLWDLAPRARHAWLAAVAPSALAAHARIADDVRRRLGRLARLAARLERGSDAGRASRI